MYSAELSSLRRLSLRKATKLHCAEHTQKFRSGLAKLKHLPVFFGFILRQDDLFACAAMWGAYQIIAGQQMLHN